MKENYSDGNKIKYLYVLFLFIGIVFVCVSFIVHHQSKKLMENGIQTTAMIKTIETKTVYERYAGERKRKKVHDVYVSYEVDGKWYVQNLGYYESGMKEGQKINIYYDSKDPNKIITDMGLWMPLLFLGSGIVLLIVGTSLYIFSNGSKKQN